MVQNITNSIIEGINFSSSLSLAISVLTNITMLVVVIGILVTDGFKPWEIRAPGKT